MSMFTRLPKTKQKRQNHKCIATKNRKKYTARPPSKFKGLLRRPPFSFAAASAAAAACASKSLGVAQWRRLLLLLSLLRWRAKGHGADDDLRIDAIYIYIYIKRQNKLHLCRDNALQKLPLVSFCVQASESVFSFYVCFPLDRAFAYFLSGLSLLLPAGEQRSFVSGEGGRYGIRQIFNKTPNCNTVLAFPQKYA